MIVMFFLELMIYLINWQVLKIFYLLIEHNLIITKF